MEENKPEVMNGSKFKVDDHEEAGGYYDDLPGFRFHPTDEELVGFYLKRKVENKPLTIELIKQIDIYKYDPWDLPRVGNVGDNEWYFYCLRGRKYKNSKRPNRVTGHGFWKATGIDRPVYSLQGGRSNENCIGLKKSLVYYRGSAGKGTKTDWMMHEFRLPTDLADRGKNANTIPKHSQEAEVWTICRILKRAVSYRKYASDLSDDPSLFNTKRNPNTHDASSITSYSSDSVHEITDGCGDGQFQVSNYMEYYNQEKPADINHVHTKNQSPIQASLTSSHCSNFPNAFAGTIFHGNENWDELGAVVEFALDPSSLFGCNYKRFSAHMCYIFLWS